MGIDIHRAKMQKLRKELVDPRYAHPTLIYEMIEAGVLGRKTGKGFYDYG